MRASVFLAIIALGVLGFPAERPRRAANDGTDGAITYLSQFGYMKPASTGTGYFAAVSPEDKLKEAIADFQNSVGLKPTGQLNDETKEAMARPRCGLPDLARSGLSKWNKNKLSFYVDHSAEDLSRSDVRKAVAEAASQWSTIVPLDFVEADSMDAADIKISFAVKAHGDNDAFDGEGRVLAHAFFPRDGRVHFDDDETWVVNNTDAIKHGHATDLVGVALHELGHAIGLEHKRGKDHYEDVMFPIWHPHFDKNGRYVTNKFSKNDIREAQEIYGKRKQIENSHPVKSGQRRPPPPLSPYSERKEINSENNAGMATPPPPLPYGEAKAPTPTPPRRPSHPPLTTVKPYVPPPPPPPPPPPTPPPPPPQRKAEASVASSIKRPRCPEEGFKYYPPTNKCYIGFSSSGFEQWTLSKGKDYCETHYPGYSIPSVHSWKENEWLADLYDERAIFLGYTSNNSLDFRTMDGTKMNFVNFRASEPDTLAPEENCVIVYGRQDSSFGFWSNLPCTIRFSFFCAGPAL